MLYNLREYHQPTELDDALRLLLRQDIKTKLLAGGTTVVGEGGGDIEAVVDLSKVGLDFIEKEEGILHIGAMVTLQRIVEELADLDGGLLAEAARRVAGWNLRNTATIGGMLVGGDIHSPLSVCMAALKARVKLYQQAGESPYWVDIAKQARLNSLHGKIVTAFSVIRSQTPFGAAYEQVGRTPADRPIVCAASSVTQTEQGNIEAVTAVGGLLNDLLLIEQNIGGDHQTGLEGISSSIVDARSPSAAYQNDYLGSAEYRQSIAPVVARRSLQNALSHLENARIK